MHICKDGGYRARLKENALSEVDLALSIALLCTVFAGFGLDAILTTETSREPERLREVFWNAIAAKGAFGLIGIAAALAITALGGYRVELGVAVALLAVAAVVELIAKTLYATFQAFDDMRPVATSLALQRVATAAIGIPVMVVGGSVSVVCAIYLLCAVLALAYAARAMHRGAGLPNVTQVLLPREEAFREQRKADSRASRPQVVERACERVVDEH